MFVDERMVETVCLATLFRLSLFPLRLEAYPPVVCRVILCRRRSLQNAVEFAEALSSSTLI